MESKSIDISRSIDDATLKSKTMNSTSNEWLKMNPIDDVDASVRDESRESTNASSSSMSSSQRAFDDIERGIATSNASNDGVASSTVKLSFRDEWASSSTTSTTPSLMMSGNSNDGKRTRTKARVWGRDVALSDGRLLATLAVGALLAYLGFTGAQEGVFRRATGDFKYGGVVSLCTCAVYCALAQMERFRNGDVGKRRGRMIDYAMLSLMTSGSMYLTNCALGYINYTTRIVAKCSKIIPVMIVGTFMHGRRYGLGDYLSCSLLVLGVTMFSMGDVDSFPTFHWRGVVYIVCALFMESTAGNFEERRFFSIPQPISHCEVVFYVNAIGSAFLATGLFASGELFIALAHVLSEPLVLATICLAAVFGYISVTCILLCLRYYGATNTEVIKTLRKMFSLILSLVVYPKPFGWKYACGTVATAIALFSLYTIKMRRLRASGGSLDAAK